ncbi:GNAT family N-acetyltransferase [Herbiconiux sp. KACC 21604]|uniref:GNAT family N-acetyltransferase n=1 Tax=unclassified Herbiconiux TaxID=2618217 RepID=UPI001490A332|nr:GNAT family N-acetyltransferase [Herbiconiux sp. SALV-R1]QJU52686.1 GNAT family N-acetyltransferase [Herbiconiux sp. SALV-R1]WPO87584.1 GNAT family N-acetyltransferase [Herbiconiux sp. KACC 21604]
MTTSIRPWAEGDLALLMRANDPVMTEFLGGPEAEEKVRERHEKYLRFAQLETAGIFAIEHDGVAVGGVNWWQSEWHDEATLETGWFVVPEVQGRGVAAAGVSAALDDARARSERRRILAFPATANHPSNRLCARVGFERIGEERFPYRDTELHVAVWSLDLGPRT